MTMLMQDCNLQSYYSHYNDGRSNGNNKMEYCEEIYSEISSPTDNGTDSGTTKTVGDIYFMTFPNEYGNSKTLPNNHTRRDRRYHQYRDYSAVQDVNSKSLPLIKDLCEYKDSCPFAFSVITLIFSIIDIAIQVVLCYSLYYMRKDQWQLPLYVLLTSSILVNILSLIWYIQDYHRRSTLDSNIPKRPKLTALQWILKVFSHLTLLGHLTRYLDLLYFAYKNHCAIEEEEKKKYKENYLSILHQNTNLSINHASSDDNEQSNDTNETQDCAYFYLLTVNEDRDTALLSLVKSFTQSAEMVLLLCHMIASSKQIDNTIVMFQLASIISSLMYISWSLASYHRATRRSIPSKRKMSLMAIILQILWRFFTLTSRLVAIGLFISAYTYWILPIAIGHWGVMTIWIMHQGTSFCRNEQFEYLLNMIIGTVYLFCFINIKDEPTRYKYIAYYVIVFIENTVFIALWYLKITSHSLSNIIGVTGPLSTESISVNHTAVAMVSGLFGSFFAGLLFMLLYYRFFHPNGRPLWVNKAAKCC
ncbi:XK-related protein 6-like [Brevipalpus obovatus]|uniref:XK-related protein 6-like n=1 Tax=Brevipalpus obovatus TaxID=246614 RepID=UPI003D9EAD45